MEKSAISGMIRYEIDSDAATGERPIPDARPTGATDDGGSPVEMVSGQRRQRPESPLSLTVRSARPQDAVGLRAIRSRVRLNQPESLLEPRGPVRATVASLVPWSRPRTRVFVAAAAGTLVGYVQFEPMLPDQRWVLTGLGAATGVYDDEPVLEELVSRAVVAAGLAGVKRLYARVDERSDIGEVLRSVGFVPYASETLLVARDPRQRRGGGVARLRRQETTDTWAIHQLYNAAVPRQVQYAEAYTSHRWDLDPKRHRDRFGAISGWLIEEGHHVVSYARVASRSGQHVLELVFHPDRLDLLNDLVDGALARIAALGARRVYCAVRGYQTEAVTVLERSGFVAVVEQNLYLKYTTANARLPAFESVPLHVEVREKLPQRVPTFLQGQPRDESAT